MQLIVNANRFTSVRMMDWIGFLAGRSAYLLDSGATSMVYVLTFEWNKICFYCEYNPLVGLSAGLVNTNSMHGVINSPKYILYVH